MGSKIVSLTSFVSGDIKSTFYTLVKHIMFGQSRFKIVAGTVKVKIWLGCFKRFEHHLVELRLGENLFLLFLWLINFLGWDLKSEICFSTSLAGWRFCLRLSGCF